MCTVAKQLWSRLLECVARHMGAPCDQLRCQARPTLLAASSAALNGNALPIADASRAAGRRPHGGFFGRPETEKFTEEHSDLLGLTLDVHGIARQRHGHWKCPRLHWRDHWRRVNIPALRADMATTNPRRIAVPSTVLPTSPEQLERAHAEVAAIREEVRRRLLDDRSSFQPAQAGRIGSAGSGKRQCPTRRPSESHRQ